MNSNQPSLRVLAAAALVVLGCASGPVANHETIPGGLAPHQTYAVVEHPVGNRASVDEAVERTIHARMEARGYARAAIDDADVLVSYKLLASQHEAVAPLHGPVSAPAAAAQIDDALFVDANVEADKALLVLIQERESFRTIWLGWTISRDIGAAELGEATERSLEQILNGVPPARP